jgi:hypothetical protein
MKTRVSFVELMHIEPKQLHTSGAGRVGSYTVPLGIATVVAYINKMKFDVDTQIFKRTNHFISYLQDKMPTVACFSNYVWNSNLSCEFAKIIKRRIS